MAANPYAELVDGNPYEALVEGRKEEPAKQAMKSGRAIVEPNELQRRMGISKNRYKDENLAGNIGRGFLTMGEDAGREATLLASGFGASPGVANAAGFAADLGSAFIPMIPAGKAASTAAPAFEKTGQVLMRSAMKPTLQEVKRGRAATAVQTMLDEGLNPTASGVEKMKAKIAELGETVQDAISTSGATISTKEVADYVPSALDRFKNGPLASQAVDDLGKVQTAFIEHPNVQGAKDIPIQLAQAMKSGYQKAIGDKGYGELKSAMTEGEKQIARGLREKIAEAVPSVTNPLSRESDLIRALKIAERRVAVDANKNPIGLGWLAQPWMVPFWMWDRSALAKAMTARGLYSGSEQIPTNLGRLGGGLMYEGARPDQGALYKP